MTFNLGRIKPVIKGAWVSGTTYKELDIVTVSGSSYIRKVAGAGTTSPESDLANWELNAAKGDAGNDGAQGIQGIQGIPGVKGDTGISSTLPQNAQSTAYTLVASDVGKHIYMTGGSITVPANVFAIGDCILVFNDSISSMTITCSAVSAYVSGTNLLKTSVSLVSKGLLNIMFYSNNSCVLSGNII